MIANEHSTEWGEQDAGSTDVDAGVRVLQNHRPRRPFPKSLQSLVHRSRRPYLSHVCHVSALPLPGQSAADGSSTCVSAGPLHSGPALSVASSGGSGTASPVCSWKMSM